MIPRTIPDGCWPMALAYLFGVPIEEVAHLSGQVCPKEVQFEKTTEWLRGRGLFMLTLLRVNGQWPIEQLPQDTLAIAIGWAQGDHCEHAIVVQVVNAGTRLRLKKVYCPGGEGLAEDYALCFFARRFESAK
jgi:hypothetical protein